MVEPYLRRSPLAHKGLAARAAEAPADAGVSLGESPHRCQIDLRGNPNDDVFMAAVASVIGIQLPVTPNRAASGQGLAALWLGPDEWLIVGRARPREGSRGRLAPGADRASMPPSSISPRRARSSPSPAPGPGRCCRRERRSISIPAPSTPAIAPRPASRRANIILHQIDASPRYDVYVQNSFADYLWNWMERAAAEYGLAVRGAEA